MLRGVEPESAPPFFFVFVLPSLRETKQALEMLENGVPEKNTPNVFLPLLVQDADFRRVDKCAQVMHAILMGSIIFTV